MWKIEFKKVLWEKQTGSIFYEGNFYPYSVEYVWEDEDWDGSVFNIKTSWFEEEFLQEDLDEFFQNTVYTWIDIFLERQKEEKLKSLTVRFFESDIDFLKKYAIKNNMKYQTMMREIIHKAVLDLQKEDN